MYIYKSQLNGFKPTFYLNESKASEETKKALMNDYYVEHAEAIYDIYCEQDLNKTTWFALINNDGKRTKVQRSYTKIEVIE